MIQDGKKFILEYVSYNLYFSVCKLDVGANVTKVVLN